ncbi:MAG: type II toxin-antitoxin system VapB family antitoxin [Microbacterium sp.]
MSLNVKNDRVVGLARELATLLGTSQVSALEAALREKLDREKAARAPSVRDRIVADLRRMRALADGGPTRLEIDADLYDADGLPR